MSELDSSEDYLGRRNAIPIPRMAPYEDEKEPEESRLTRLRIALGGAAQTISGVYHDIIDPHRKPNRNRDSF